MVEADSKVGIRLDTEELLAEAQRRTGGLSDFGPGDFLPNLDVYLDSIARECRLDEAQTATIRDNALMRLTNRLQIEAWYKEHPEIADTPVVAPINIFSMPRTGTTAFVNIMSLDDSRRCLRSWEQLNSIPPPEADDTNDPRRLEAVARNEWMARERPEMMALHLWDADATEEDVEILGTNFASQQLVLPMFDYHAAWRVKDLRPTFAYHRRVMQLLQSHKGPNRWLFKAPAYTFHLEAVASAYPDARFIMTHRDPAKAVPSSASFTRTFEPKGSGIPERMARYGQYHSDHLQAGLRAAVAARARMGEHRFFDVHHRDFVRDPFGVLEDVYAFLGEDLRPHVRARMERWHAANRSGAHGAHRYTPEDFGLSNAQIRKDFDFYIQRFGVHVEG